MSKQTAVISFEDIHNVQIASNDLIDTINRHIDRHMLSDIQNDQLTAAMINLATRILGTLSPLAEHTIYNGPLTVQYTVH